MAWKGVVVYLALMGVMTITWRMFGPGRRGGGWDGPHPPPSHSDDGSSGSGRPEQDGGKGGGGGGSPGGWEDHEHDHRPDGVPLECISWDASSYSPFPISISQLTSLRRSTRKSAQGEARTARSFSRLTAASSSRT